MQKENNAPAFGEFETAEELIKAYDALKEENRELKENIAPVDEKDLDGDEWQEKISAFMTKYPSAKAYASEIGKILMEVEGEIGDNALEQAYVKLLESRKTPEELIHDDAFLEEFVYVSPKIKEKIISDYLSEIDDKTPGVMQAGGQTFVTPPKSPRNLSEAMKLAEKLLSK